MTERAPSKGWIVRVTTKRVGGGPPSVEIYDVAIPDAADAVEAVRKACGAGADIVVETAKCLHDDGGWLMPLRQPKPEHRSAVRDQR